MTYRDKLVANSTPKKNGEIVNLIEMVNDNKLIVAKSVSKNDEYDVVVARDSIDSGTILYLKRIYDLDADIENENSVYILSLSSWQRLQEKNLWNKQLD